MFWNKKNKESRKINNKSNRMSKKRKLYNLVIKMLSIVLCIFHLYTGIFGLLPNFQQRAIHVMLVMSLAFLVYPIKRINIKKAYPHWADILAILIIVLSGSYIYLNYLYFSPFMVRSINYFEITLGILTAILILEISRRTIGLTLPILAFLAFIYTVLGHYIPGNWGHPYIKFSYYITHLYLDSGGIWGFLTGLSASYLTIFIMFGILLLYSGAGKVLIDLSLCVAGKLIGGPAKVAVISSAFFAMLSGSASANVATTGSFTIPLMKSLGYRSEFASAVEATASTGGIITPPIMGSAGFIIAEILSISYFKVALAASIPAFLFYLSVFMGVHFQSIRGNLKPLPKEKLPKLSKVLTLSNIFCLFFPIGVLIFMLFRGYSLTSVGTGSCIAVLITYIFKDISAQNIINRIKNIPYLFEKTGKALIAIPAMLISANIILYMINFTGISLKFSAFILSLGENNLFLILILSGFLVMILGMGLPSAPSYVLGITVAAPPLFILGIEPLAVHLFILYYAILANITPPVCPAVFVAAIIAKTKWIETAKIALLLSPMLYIMPFVFVFNNSFILIGSIFHIIVDVGSAVIGVILFSSGLMGYLIRKCNYIERILLILSGFFLILTDLRFEVPAFIISSLILLFQKYQLFRYKINTKNYNIK